MEKSPWRSSSISHNNPQLGDRGVFSSKIPILINLFIGSITFQSLHRLSWLSSGGIKRNQLSCVCRVGNSGLVNPWIPQEPAQGTAWNPHYWSLQSPGKGAGRLLETTDFIPWAATKTSPFLVGFFSPGNVVFRSYPSKGISPHLLLPCLYGQAADLPEYCWDIQLFTESETNSSTTLWGATSFYLFYSSAAWRNSLWKKQTTHTRPPPALRAAAAGPGCPN